MANVYHFAYANATLILTTKATDTNPELPNYPTPRINLGNGLMAGLRRKKQDVFSVATVTPLASPV
jgi:hypothetical protein